jgi:hypothetical protein
MTLAPATSVHHKDKPSNAMAVENREPNNHAINACLYLYHEEIAIRSASWCCLLLVWSITKTVLSFADLYDCGYRIVNDNHLIKMASTKPAPPYPDPEELDGPFYQQKHSRSSSKAAAARESAAAQPLSMNLSDPILSSSAYQAPASETKQEEKRGRNGSARVAAMSPNAKVSSSDIECCLEWFH